MRAWWSFHVVNFIVLAFVFELLAVTCLTLLCRYQSAVTFAAHESLFVDACCELVVLAFVFELLAVTCFGTAVQVPGCCHLGCA